MAEKSKCEELINLGKFIRVADLNNKSLEAGPFEVIAVNRYLLDPQHVSQTGDEFTQGNVDVTQVTLGNETHKQNVLLSPALNDLIQKKQLVVGSQVILRKCKLYYDETDLSGTSVIIILDMQITGWKSLISQTVNALSWCPNSQENRPITSARAYFVNVWSTAEMWGDIWKNQAQVQSSLGEVRVEDLSTVKEVAKKKWSSLKNNNPTLLVRVLLKSRIIHYVKPSKSDKWPFQAHILVADRSGASTAVFWNAMCPNFYHTINEGDVLLLKHFTVKKSYQVSPRFRPALHNLELFDIDLNLNSHHPPSEVKHIDPDLVADQLELPKIQTNFVTRRQIRDLPNNFICDVAGVVVYTGRLEREPMKNKFGHDSGGFWVRRWLHLVDGTSKKPFYIQLYRTAQGIGPCEIQPGQMVVCRHMRLIHRLNQVVSSRSPVHVHLTSTAESQVTFLENGQAHFLKEETAVKDVWTWRSTREGTSAVNQAVVGGYHQYPPLPSTLVAVRNMYTDIPVLASVQWENVLKGLKYRESRQILIQAVIAHIKLKNMPGNRETENDASPSKKRRTGISEVTLDPELFHGDTLTTFGADTTGETTLSLLYSSENWSAVRKRLELPDMTVTEDSAVDPHNGLGNSLKTRSVPYFHITLMGLNSKVILQTLYMCHTPVTSDTNFLDMLSGTGSDHTPLPCSQSESLCEVLSSAHQCANKRFLFVLDCYQDDELELVINRALPLSSVT